MMRILNLLLGGFVITGGAWFYVETKPEPPEPAPQAAKQQGPKEADGQRAGQWLGPVPAHALLLNNRAWILATSPDAALRDGGRAIALATKACEATRWGHASFLDTLAAAYAEAGQFSEAIQYQQRAILALGPDDQQVQQDFRVRLQAYSQGQPHRQ